MDAPHRWRRLPLGMVGLVLPLALLQSQPKSEPALTPAAVDSAGMLIGLTFTPAERDSMLEALTELRSDYGLIRAVMLPNSAGPAFGFDVRPEGFQARGVSSGVRQSAPGELPTDPLDTMSGVSL